MTAIDEQKALRGDAWTEFEARLRVYVCRRVDPLWADDVVGDILLRLVEYREGLENAENPMAWMHRVAANAVTDHYRRRSTEQRALKLVHTDAMAAFPEAEATSDDGTVEMARCVMPFIRDLADRYREAVVLTEIEGLTQATVARRLGLSYSGAKSRIQRGRAKLRQALLRRCDVEVDRRGGILGCRPRSSELHSCC